MYQDRKLSILWYAVTHKYLISFVYKDDPAARIVEPYAVFPNAHGDLLIDGRHTKGYSNSDQSRWRYRMFKLEAIRSLRLYQPYKESNAPYNPDSKLYTNALFKR
jgi:hypothetical protein